MKTKGESLRKFPNGVKNRIILGGQDKSKKPVKRTGAGDMAQVKEWNKIITDVLKFRTRNEVIPILRQAFGVWRGIPHEIAENEIADIILSYYLQQGKIRDYIEKMSALVERIDSMDDPDKVRFMAYNNYFYFLQQFIWDMKEKIEHAKPDNIPLLQDDNMDTVAWFIHDECRSVTYLRDVPKAYDALKRLKKGLKRGDPMTSEQVKDKTTVSLCIELLLAGVTDDDKTEMKRIEENLRERALLIRQNIKKAKVLYQAIDKCFTDEWFNQVNPDHESCVINDLSKDALKDIYKEKIEEFKAMISGIDF